MLARGFAARARSGAGARAETTHRRGRPVRLRQDGPSAGRSLQVRQWRVARQDRNPTRPRRLWRVLRGHRPDAGETPRHRGRGLEDGEQDARIRSAEARRLLRSVHGRGARRPAGEGSARSGARANRCAREQDRPGALHGAHADAEHDDARRRRSGRGRTGSQDVRSLSVAERPRPPRSRLLPQSRP